MVGNAATHSLVRHAGHTGIRFQTIDDPIDDSDAVRRNWPDGIDLLIIDSYALDATFERQCRGWATRILVVDDLADRDHEADFLLDQTYGRRADDYRARVPTGCTLLLGSEFALLRDAFGDARESTLCNRVERTSVGRILVATGSTDPDNHTQLALEAISQSGLDAAVDIILSSSAPHIANIRASLGAAGRRVALHVDVSAETLAGLIGQADIAIGAGGAAAWERCCLGLPTLALMTAENQRTVIAQLATAGALRDLGDAASVTAEQLADALRELANDSAARRAMAARANQLCDGHGARRVAAALEH